MHQRVTVVILCVCLCVCLCVTTFSAISFILCYNNDSDKHRSVCSRLYKCDFLCKSFVHKLCRHLLTAMYCMHRGDGSLDITMKGDVTRQTGFHLHSE